MENHGENKVPNICILSCIYYGIYLKFTGYVANHFDTHKFHLRGKSQPYELSKKIKF